MIIKVNICKLCNVYKNFEKCIDIVIMVEEIKLIYKLKGFDTKYFSNNESKCTFNFASSFEKILSNYYERK